nr:hypothetical protein [Tanacetum cinerariifolium]
MVINSPCLTNKKELAILGQTATGKEISNLLMAGSLSKTTLPTQLTTLKIKTVNDDVRLQALIDGKKVVIIEDSIRHDLVLNGAEGSSCLPNVVIFEELARMGKHKPKRKERKERKETEVSLTELHSKDHVPTTFNDPLPSGEDRMQLKELMEESSKQGRKITDIDIDAEVNLENVIDADGKAVVEEMVEVITTAKIIVDEVSTVGGELSAVIEEPVSVAPTNITTTQPSEATKITVNISTTLKSKGIVFHDMEESKTRTTSFEEEYNKVQTLFKEGLDMDAKRIIAPRKRTRKEKVEKDQTAKKQKGDELEQDNIEKQKLEEQQEAGELKRNLEIVLNDEDVVFVNVTPLSSKPLTIMDYKIYKEGNKEHFQIIRANGNHQMYLAFSTILKNFNREDLKVL